MALRVGIVDRRQRSLAVQVAGQVARFPRCIRNRHDLRGRAALLEAFIVEEEECAILTIVNFRNPYRPTQCESELVELEGWPRRGEVAARVQLGIAKEFIQANVVFVGAGSDRDIDVGPGRGTIARGHVGLNLEFGNGVDGGSDRGRLEECAVVVGAVERVVRVVASSTSYGPSLAVQGFAGSARAPRRAWSESNEIIEIAPVKRQFHHLCIVYNCGNRPFGRL